MSEFKPQVAPGSTYAVQVSEINHHKVEMIQDNGQAVVILKDDLQKLIDILKNLEGGPNEL